MNNEIKKILELLGSTDENIMFCDIVELNSKQSHLLYDYITNLQEYYNDNVNKYSNLQEENDKLQNIIDIRNEELELVKTKFIEEHNKCYDYKSRIDKAIKELRTANVDLDNIQLCEIIEYAIHILKGEDND